MTRTMVNCILVGAVMAAGSGIFRAPVAFAQSCYMDNDGRIVTRRRPGYREVPCPDVTDAGEPVDADDDADGADSEISDARRRADLALESQDQIGRPSRTRSRWCSTADA